MIWKAVTVLVLAAAVAGVRPGPAQTPAPQEETPDSLAYTFYDSLYEFELPPDTFTTLMPSFVGFGEGEKLIFSVQYSLVKAGEATLEIRNIADIDGHSSYRIISDARTNGFFSSFFKVRDRFESYMDTTELYSLRYEKHLREGRFKRDEEVSFDQNAHTATYKDKVVAIAPRTQDVLSALYYIRTLPLEVGQAVTLANHTDGKNYPLVVKVHRRETVTVDAGTFDCLVVEPILRGPAIFSQKGRLTVWITDDRYRMPVLMKSKVIIGHVSAVLKEYTLAKKFR